MPNLTGDVDQLDGIRRRVRGVLFDKDGTLFSFENGEGDIGRRLIFELSHGDASITQALAKSGGYDPAAGRYAPHSLIASGSWTALAERWAHDLPFWGAEELETWLRLEAASFARMAKTPPSTDLPKILGRLAEAGLRLGLATNDAVGSARRQLERANVLKLFDFVGGYGGGFAAKPDPAMLHGFCRAADLSPGSVVVVGDGLTDLAMARAGGALAGIGVLSGPAQADVLAPEADLLLPSISDLPDALAP